MSVDLKDKRILEELNALGKVTLFTQDAGFKSYRFILEALLLFSDIISSL